MSKQRSSRWFLGGWGLLALCAILGLILGVYYGLSGLRSGFFARRAGDGQSGDSLQGSRFEKLVRAASLLENVQYDQALAAYNELAEKDRSVSVLRNRAIASLANVKYNIDLAQDPKNDVEGIRGRLPGLFEQSSSAISEYMRVAPDDPIACQLSVLRDARWIAVLAAANPIIADEEQANLLKKLERFVEQFPGNAFLATQYNNSAEAMSAVEPEVLQKTVGPLRSAYEANPRNIYLLCLLVQRLVQLKDPAVLGYVEPLAKLLEPFEWKWKMERRPKDLGDLRRALEVGKQDLDGAMSILIGWVGEAKATEGSLVDARSIDVNELAFLDLRDVQAILQDRTTQGAKIPSSPVQSLVLDVPGSQGARFFDWDVDTRPEVLVWTQTELQLGQADLKGNWSELAQLRLPWPILGLLPADLFSVDAHRGTPAPRDAETMDPQKQLQASVRHETIRDLLLYGDQGIQIVQIGPILDGKPTWTLLDESVGLSDLKEVTAVAPIDWESDGDLDLVIIAQGKLVLRENRGNRMFQEASGFSMLPDPSRTAMSLAAADIDRDVDLDMVVSFKDGLGVMENIQHGQFRFRELVDSDGKSSFGPAGSLAIAELNNDYSWDLVLGGADSDSKAIFTATDYKTGAVRFVRQGGLCREPAKIVTGDWNNDSRIDVLASTASGVRLCLNQGDGSFSVVPWSQLASPLETIPPIGLGDIDSDGWLEAIGIEEGKPKLFFSDSRLENRYMVYRVKGISDPNGGGRNNQYAVGSTMEVFGPFGYQARIIEDDSVHFGLGQAQAYSLRTIFVNGLTQGIIDPRSNEVLEEKQVLIGSCPFLYGWDGTRWVLATDLLWNAPLGLQVAKGKVLADRRWEYLSVDGATMKPKDGYYELRITEELWETAYFDHLALLAVDHPADSQWYSNEKVGPGAIAQPSLWGYQATEEALSVKDSRGRDWINEVRDKDGVYAIAFEKQFKQGLVEASYLEIDFGTIDTTRGAQLVLTGWIYPTDTSLNIHIDQNKDLELPKPLSLWTVDAAGEFRETVPFTGFPGGKPKTIVVPLEGLFASKDHRIRLAYSSQIYWDQIRLGYGGSIPISAADNPQRPMVLASNDGKSLAEVSLKWLTLESADLHYRGFSRELPRTRHEPHWYDYQSVSDQAAWPPLRGKFTRYGDVDSLLGFNDDLLVVLGPGDEMVVRFEIPKEPIPEGWVRDFVLHSVGWDKDAAMNTLEGQSSLPLPFSKMSQYPPGIEDRQEAGRVGRMHEKTLTREQSPEGFWKRSPAGSVGRQ
ncbi:MAG: VCBS repeat-containing protein [Planctomycetota bacterium]|nr:VCBS repeat-containing protein [Planctomycetota bacterium]